MEKPECFHHGINYRDDCAECIDIFEEDGEKFRLERVEKKLDCLIKLVTLLSEWKFPSKTKEILDEFK